MACRRRHARGVNQETYAREADAISARFSKSSPSAAAGGARFGAGPEAPNLKMFERADWTLFRTVEGLQQKAGVPARWLRRLVLKELGDNALDGGGRLGYGLVEADPDTFSLKMTGQGSTARQKKLRTFSASADRWVPANCFACRNADNSATACASSPAPCWRRRGRSPSSPTIVAGLETRLEGKVRDEVTERILREKKGSARGLG
jgi:hypothetical protein